jgi:hypothetical protein
MMRFNERILIKYLKLRYNDKVWAQNLKLQLNLSSYF